jgi:hypothetical protein
MKTHFQLKFSDDQLLNLEVINNSNLDPTALNPPPLAPSWAKLDYYQCAICPLEQAKVQYCPAAYSLQEIISKCSDLISHNRVTFTKQTENGSVSTETDVQKALFTVIAAAAINSACPILNSRRWVLDLYSLITTPQNMFYLSLSSYLVKQFLLSTNHEDADMELKDHVAYIDEILLVWGKLLERVRDVSNKDGSNNALIRLVATASLMKSLRKDWIEELKESAGI